MESAIQRPPRVAITFTKPTRTKASFQDECDINKLMAMYERNGSLGAVNPYPPQYGDFSNVDDYQTAVNQCIDAQTQFEQLPAKLRDRFQNDPAKLLEFMADEANRAEALDLGIITANPVPTGDNSSPEPEPDTTPPAGE